MATHDVKFTIPERELGKVDVEFKVKRDGEVIGTLRVSKGCIEWAQRDYTKGHIVNWVDFAEFMKKQPRRK